MDKDNYTIVGLRIGKSPAACLFQNNQITYCGEEEKICQNKGEKYPIASFLEILQQVKKIDYIVFIDTSGPYEKNDEEFSIDTFFILAKKANKIKDDGIPRLVDMSLHQHKCESAFGFYKSQYVNGHVINVSTQGSYWPISIDNKQTFLKETETLFEYNDNFALKTKQKNMHNLSDQESFYLENFDADFWEKNGNFDLFIYSNPTINDLYKSLSNYFKWEDINISATISLSMQGNNNDQVPQFFVDNLNYSVVDKNTVIKTSNGPVINKNSNDFLIDENSHEVTTLKNRKDTAFKAVNQSNDAVIKYVNYLIDKFGITKAVLVGDVFQENLKLISKLKLLHQSIDFYVLEEPYQISSIKGAVLLWAKNLNINKINLDLEDNKIQPDEEAIELLLKEKNLDFKKVDDNIVGKLLVNNCIAFYSVKQNFSKILFNPSIKNNHRFLTTVKERDTFKIFRAITKKELCSNYTELINNTVLYKIKKNENKDISCLISNDNNIKLDLLPADSFLSKIVDVFLENTNQQFIGHTTLRKSNTLDASNLNQVLKKCTSLDLKYLYLIDSNILVTF